MHLASAIIAFESKALPVPNLAKYKNSMVIREINEIINTDILVIGGGAAGLRAAIEAKKYDLDVMLTSESPVGFRNNTAISAAGFAATGISREPEDSPEVHLRDTITAGRFINDQFMVETMTHRARQQVYDLIKFGINYVRHHGELLVLQSAGHTYQKCWL